MQDIFSMGELCSKHGDLLLYIINLIFYLLLVCPLGIIWMHCLILDTVYPCIYQTISMVSATVVMGVGGGAG